MRKKINTLKKIGFVRDKRSPIPEDEKISRLMSTISHKNTKPELKLRQYLWHAGFKGYRLHVKTLPGKPDISFMNSKIAIFVNGCFWHRCPKCNLKIPKVHTQYWNDKFAKTVERDRKKLDMLEKNGWISIVVWECELNTNPEKCLLEIAKSLKQNPKN